MAYNSRAARRGGAAAGASILGGPGCALHTAHRAAGLLRIGMPCCYTDTPATPAEASPHAMFHVGGVAKAPPSPPLLRRRTGTGIGNAARMVVDPLQRRCLHSALPDTVAPARSGLPLLATVAAGGQHTAHDWGAAARVLLDEKLCAAGAMLLHGMPIRTAGDFDEFMAGTGFPPMETMGASDREPRGEHVFSASDDVPASHTLHPHNEQAYLAHDEDPTYPRKIFFCCLSPASGGGGETPIVLNKDLTAALRRIAPDDMQRFESGGVRYRQRLQSGALRRTGDIFQHQKISQDEETGLTWQAMFGTLDKDEAEAQAIKRGYTVEWEQHEGERDCSWTLTLLSPARPAMVEGVFWNQASNVFSFVPCWGDDGTPLENEVLERLNAAIWEVAVAFEWSVGDVLCLDNTNAAHGRMSFDGERNLVVALSKL
eukprot:COSAG05_NODE_974_length_6359_cov_3.906869_7_plen_429_part_00